MLGGTKTYPLISGRYLVPAGQRLVSTALHLQSSAASLVSGAGFSFYAFQTSSQQRVQHKPAVQMHVVSAYGLASSHAPAL